MSRLGELFSENGVLEKTIEGFHFRPQQQEMAEAVTRTLEEGGVLVCEAGTGTGKTFAYLLPALLSERKVVISTGTRNLQDQLFKRDLPRIREFAGKGVRAALLKGRSNYLCIHRMNGAGFDNRASVPVIADMLEQVRDSRMPEPVGELETALDRLGFETDGYDEVVEVVADAGNEAAATAEAMADQFEEVVAECVDDMVAEADTGARNPSAAWQSRLIIGTCITWSLFQLYIASKLPGLLAQVTGVNEFANIVAQARFVHLAFALTLATLAFPIFGHDHLEVFEAPFQLTLQTGVIFDDEELVFCFSHRLSIL